MWNRIYRLQMADHPQAVPPDFGPANPPRDSRAAGQTVRVVKDVLCCGSHKTGYDDAGRPDFWNVTPATLATIARDFNTARSRGVRWNLGKTHGDENLLIHPDDLIAPIEAVKVMGNTLWICSYVTPTEAQYLKNPSRKVSVGVVPNWEDGSGQHYRLAMVHVAVTDRPVVHNQGAFMALSDRPNRFQQARQAVQQRQAAIAERVRRIRERVPQSLALSNNRAPAQGTSQAAFNERFARAEELAKRRGISVAKAMAFIPR